MAQEIVQHGHCQVCGRVVKYGEDTCSDACKQKIESTRRGRKRQMLFLYLMMALFFVVFLVVPLLGGR